MSIFKKKEKKASLHPSGSELNVSAGIPLQPMNSRTLEVCSKVEGVGDTDNKNLDSNPVSKSGFRYKRIEKSAEHESEDTLPPEEPGCGTTENTGVGSGNLGLISHPQTNEVFEPDTPGSSRAETIPFLASTDTQSDSTNGCCGCQKLFTDSWVGRLQCRRLKLIFTRQSCYLIPAAILWIFFSIVGIATSYKEVSFSIVAAITCCFLITLFVKRGCLSGWLRVKSAGELLLLSTIYRFLRRDVKTGSRPYLRRLEWRKQNITFKHSVKDVSKIEPSDCPGIKEVKLDRISVSSDDPNAGPQPAGTTMVVNVDVHCPDSLAAESISYCVYGCQGACFCPPLETGSVRRVTFAEHPEEPERDFVCEHTGQDVACGCALLLR